VTSRTTPTRYCVIAASVAVLLLTATVVVNVVVDPFGMYRVIELDGVNSHKPAVYHRVRLVKAYEVRRVRPRGIVLGSSRSHVALRPTHEGWNPAARPVYNLAFDGATTREMYYYLRHAHAVQPLRQVVLGLDTYHATAAPATTRPDFDVHVLETPGILAPLSPIRADLRVLSSVDAVRASVATLRSQPDHEPEWFAPDGQRLGDVFFRRPGEPFVELGPRGYFEEIDRLEVGFKREGKLAAGTPQFARPGQRAEPAGETSLDYIKRIVGFCRGNGIDLRIFITPEHAHQLEITAAIGEWATIESAKRALVQLLADDAAQHPDALPIPLWDFSGYSRVTTEPLPKPDSRAEMQFYWDSSHFKEIVGDFVLDRVFGVSHSQHRIPQDFGVQLSTATIEPALARVRADQVAYRRRNPDDASWIRFLVGASAPDERNAGVIAASRD